MDFVTIIGLEVHAQLLTKSKMFCSCSTDYANTPPNTHVCQVCLGMPGVLPTINRRAVEFTIMAALALNCTISEYAKFDRKNYPYPDLMKGYQISQYDAPIGRHGWLDIEPGKRIGIIRVHLEEDVAKLVHCTSSWGESYTLVDVNRSGVPLMEVVGEPELNSPEEARQFLVKLRTILQYLGVSSGNMEEGSFRCDANISIRPLNCSSGLAKVEVKNMNSFKAVYRALEYEAERQRKAVEQGEHVVQETRGWVEEKGMTVSQRSKEYAHDYRYFPEPDLPPLQLTAAWVEELSSHLPELPQARYDRFMARYGLPAYDANLITVSRSLADYFEACLNLRHGPSPQKEAKTISNWLLGDFARLLNLTGQDITESKVTPSHLVEMVDLIEQGILSSTSAKAVFQEMFYTGKRPGEIVAEQGLTQISELAVVEEIVNQVIADNTPAVVDFKSGKTQALSFLVGQVMKQSKGRANPKLVNEVLHHALGE